MLAFIAATSVLALASAAPAARDMYSSSDYTCLQKGVNGPAAIYTALDGTKICGCMGDTMSGRGWSTELCMAVSPPYAGNATLTAGEMNACASTRAGLACSTECVPGYSRNPLDGSCVKTDVVSTSTSSLPTSTPPASSTSSTSYYCGYGTANGGRCAPASASVTSTPSSSGSHYCGYGTAANGKCNGPTSTPSSSASSHYCGFGTADNGRCNPPSSTAPPSSSSSSASASSSASSSSSISSITGAAPRLPALTASTSALLGLFALVGLALFAVGARWLGAPKYPSNYTARRSNTSGQQHSDPAGSEYAEHGARLRRDGSDGGADAAGNAGGEARRRAMGMPTGARYQPGAEGQQQGGLGGMDQPTPGVGVEIGRSSDAPRGSASP